MGSQVQPKCFRHLQHMRNNRELRKRGYLIRVGHTEALLEKKGHFSRPAETDPYVDGLEHFFHRSIIIPPSREGITTLFMKGIHPPCSLFIPGSPLPSLPAANQPLRATIGNWHSLAACNKFSTAAQNCRSNFFSSLFIARRSPIIYLWFEFTIQRNQFY